MWGVSFLDIINILTTKLLLGSLNVFVVTSLLKFIPRSAMQCTVFMNNLNQLAFMLLPLLLSTIKVNHSHNTDKKYKPRAND